MEHEMELSPSGAPSPVPSLLPPTSSPGSDAHAGPPSVLVDTVLLIVLRIAYFYLARRYLLAQLNPALRELQKPDAALPTHHVRDSPGASLSSRRDRANSRASLASVLSTQSARSVSASAAASSSASTLGTGLSTSTGIGSNGTTSRPSSVHGAPFPPSTSLPDTEADDSEDDPSSYPASGAATPPQNTIHITHDDVTSPRASGSGGDHNQAIEMNLLCAKLRDVQARPRVLELAHRAERTGTRSGKRAARGLGRVARTLFAVCFAESMNLLTLVIFQTLGILHARARQVNFAVSLHVLLAIVLLVVPLVQCLLFTYRSRESNTTSTRAPSLSFRSRLLISILPFALYIFAFTRIPPYITVIDDWEGGGWLVPSLGRMVVLGVLIMASLSGIGAVKTAWDYLERAAGGGRKISDSDVLQAERSLYRVRQDMVAKRDELNRLAAAEPERTGGWMSGVFGSKSGQQSAVFKAELQGLQAMEAQLTRSLAGMKTKKKRQVFRNTLTGMVVTVLGYIFAIYCAARLIMCLISIFITPLSTSTLDPSNAKGNTNGDWISFIIALGLSHLPHPFGELDIATWSRGISLLLTGLLILSSLTMVLRWLTRVLRMTSKTVGAGFLLLTLGQLYATYVISLLVQLRSSLPDPPDVIVDNTGHAGYGGNVSESASAAETYAAAAVAAATVHVDDSLLRSLPDFRVFGRLFDVVFLLAALGTAVYRYIAMRVDRSDDGAVFEIGR